MKKLSVLLLGLALSAVLTGCKIRIDVPENGKVVTESGAIECDSGKRCDIDVVDLFFDETFIAQPSSGYTFSGWQKRERGFCGGNTDACRLFTSGFEGNAALMSFLGGNEVFYLTPTFSASNSGLDCNAYAGNSGLCIDGNNQYCNFSYEQAYRITTGMTYNEVISILGCHGHLVGWGGSATSGALVATYSWKTDSSLTRMVHVSLTGYDGSIPTVGSVVVN